MIEQHGVTYTVDANSANSRPERFGGPMPQPHELDIPVSARTKPEEVGPIIRGILARRNYIFTHPTSAEMLKTFTIQPPARRLRLRSADDRLLR